MRQDSIPLSLIRTDGGTQCRAFIDQHVVQEYADLVRGGTVFPPVVVFHDGSEYWLADGFHRVAAHVEAEREEIDVDQREGTKRDAVLFAAGANIDHGLRRTNADKRAAVVRLLEDDEWAAWSDGEIARRCGVSQPFVSKLRGLTHNGCESPERTYTTRHGTVATMDTSKIGARDLHEGERDEDGNLVGPPVERRAGGEEGSGLGEQLKAGLGERYHDGIQLDSDLSQWFTPPELASVAARLACVEVVPVRVLDPAAGSGALLEALVDAAGEDGIDTGGVDAVELDPRWFDYLVEKGWLAEEGSYLDRPAPDELYDVALLNPPYENGLDGDFMAKVMDEAMVVVAILRVNALHGEARFEKVWSRVNTPDGDWGQTHETKCWRRPSFGGGSAKHDFCVVRLERGYEGPCVTRWIDPRNPVPSEAFL